MNRLLPAWLAVGLLAALLPADPLAAQSRNIRFERISIEEGLSQGTVNCMLQDRVGFMWFGTQDGLDRYDGRRFEALAHDPDDPATLNDNWILALLEDAATGDLWVGTQTGGLSRWRLESGSFTHYPHDALDPQSLAGDEVRALLQDRDGSLWVGLADDGLDRLDPATGVFEHFRHQSAGPDSLSHDEVRALYRDRGGDLWVGTLGGLNRFDPETGGFHRFLHDPADPASLSDDRVRAILEDRSGRLWIGTFGGLDRLDRSTGAFEHFRHDPADLSSLSDNRIRTLYEDRDGGLWIGTDGALDLFDPASQSFIHYRHNPADPTSLSADRVMSIYQDHGGVLWFGMQGGLNKWSPRTWSFSHFKSDPSRPTSLSSDKILSLSVDGEGAIWIGTNGHGLDRFDRTSGTVTHYRKGSQPGSLSDDIVTALYHDRDGVLWVGTYGGGLHRLVEGRRGFERWRHDPQDAASLSGDRVTAMAEDALGSLWVGTFGSGLNRLGPDGETFLRFTHEPERRSSLSNDVILVIHLSPIGDLWIGTQIGLNRLERIDETAGVATFRPYFAADGLPNEFIYGIYTDSGGNLWLSTNRGLSRFDPRTESFKNYDSSHGLQADEFNMNAHFQSPTGELFFGGTGGFNAFFPERIEPNTSAPPVVLTSFSKLNRPVRLERPIFETGEVALDHRDSIVSFEFAALDFTAPERNRYRYLLEGFSDEWIDLGHHRRVSFTNLDAGSYVLRFQGSNNDGVWSDPGASIRIAVSPAPWQTWWAYAAYLLALSGIVWGYVSQQHRKVERERAVSNRLREVDKLKDELLAKMRQVVEDQKGQVREREQHLAERERLIAELEAKNAELERFNYTVSHDLKSPLVTIKGFLGLLRRDAANGDVERLDHDVQRISAAADKMHTLLEELLELSRIGHQVHEPDEVRMRDLAFEAVELVGGSIDESDAEIEIAHDLPPAVGDRVRLIEVYQNLITNALKYMGSQNAPRIEIGCQQNGSGPCFYVRDNGLGIDPRYHEKIFGLFERLDARSEGSGVGLALVKRIIEMHGGRIWVESKGLGAGSTFYFTLEPPAPAARRMAN